MSASERLRGCRECGKKPYPSEAAALVELRKLKAIGCRRAYRCTLPGCRAWHLTSQPNLGRR